MTILRDEFPVKDFPGASLRVNRLFLESRRVASRYLNWPLGGVLSPRERDSLASVVNPPWIAVMVRFCPVTGSRHFAAPVTSRWRRDGVNLQRKLLMHQAGLAQPVCPTEFIAPGPGLRSRSARAFGGCGHVNKYTTSTGCVCDKGKHAETHWLWAYISFRDASIICDRLDPRLAVEMPMPCRSRTGFFPFVDTGVK